MPTFDAAVEDYDVNKLVVGGAERGWRVDAARAAVLIHDLLPYYVDVLPPRVRGVVVEQAQRVVDWARADGVPVATEASADYTLAQHRSALELIRATTGEVVSVASFGSSPSERAR